MSEPILRVEHLSRSFGALQAVNDVSFEVPAGQMRAVIGPNGAGKTTLMDLICNRTPASSGKVLFKGLDITKMAPHKIVRKGMCKCFQITKIFQNLTVYENVRIARINMKKRVFSLLAIKDTYLMDEVAHFLSLVGIQDKMNEIAGFLSYGDQRRLDIAIALAMEPELLILDEPAAGVSRDEANRLMELIRNLGVQQMMTMLFIEHDMDIVFNYAESISVMVNGGMVATGTPAEIRKNAYVQEAYLGKGAE